METSYRWTSCLSSATRSFLSSSSHGMLLTLSFILSVLGCVFWSSSLCCSLLVVVVVVNRRLRSWYFCWQFSAVVKIEGREVLVCSSKATESQFLNPCRFTAHANNSSSHVPHVVWLVSFAMIVEAVCICLCSLLFSSLLYSNSPRSICFQNKTAQGIFEFIF